MAYHINNEIISISKHLQKKKTPKTNKTNKQTKTKKHAQPALGYV